MPNLRNSLVTHKKTHIFALAFMSGVFSALSMAPLNFWPILFATLSCFYVLLHKASSLFTASLIGLLFGFGYFGFGLYWVGNALLVDGNPYRWAWPLAVCGLPLILSPFWAMACTIIKKIGNLDKLIGYTAFCLIFTIFEWLRGHLFTGFPWNLFGYTWSDFLIIAQTASLYNIYLLTFLTILWASFPAFLMLCAKDNKPQKTIAFFITVFTFCASFAYGSYKLSLPNNNINKDYNFVLVQPNILQNEKWDPKIVVQNFIDMLKQSSNNQKDKTFSNSSIKTTYIIWPETAINSGLLSTAWARSAIADMLATYEGSAYLISGAQRFIPENGHFFNSIVILNKNAEIIATYDKSHLVPFGEYMPLSSFFDIAPIVGFSGFQKGKGTMNLQLPEGVKISPLICYEVIFPDEIIENSDDKPDYLINVTNDAWYSFSAGPYQHLVQAQFRAIETGIPLIRVANTGFSAVINSRGEFLYKSSIFEKTQTVIQYKE